MSEVKSRRPGSSGVKSVSPFESIAGLPSISAFSGDANAHAAIHGLLGASRSLAIGALGLLKAQERASPETSIVVAAVDGPESALDLVGDLRAFLALDEAFKNA